MPRLDIEPSELLPREDPCGVDGPPYSEPKHCWHPANINHALPNHRDEVCCFCGHFSCLSLSDVNTGAHGKFLPKRFYESTGYRIVQ